MIRAIATVVIAFEVADLDIRILSELYGIVDLHSQALLLYQHSRSEACI